MNVTEGVKKIDSEESDSSNIGKKLAIYFLQILKLFYQVIFRDMFVGSERIDSQAIAMLQCFVS